MSMSEFERQSNPGGEHFSSRSTTGHELPPDFNKASVYQAVPTIDPLYVVTQLAGDTTGLFTGDVLAIFPDEAVDGSYLRLVGSDFPLPEKHTQKGVSHSH